MRRVLKTKAFNVYGFEKSERSNIDSREEVALKLLASDLLKLSSMAIDQQVEDGKLSEICHEREDQESDPGNRS